ncbi:MAG: TonB-dependent receptor, partial [Bacteroidota bacterium]
FGIDSSDPANHPALQALDVALVNENQDILLNEPVIEYGNSATFNDLKNYANLLEANYSFETGAVEHNALIGFDYTYSTDRITFERFPNSIGSFKNPDPSIMPNILDLNAAASPYRDIQVRAGLNFQDQVMLFDQRLHLLLGLRFNWYRRDRVYDNESERPDDYRNVIDRPVTPRMGLVYKWRPNVSLYASYSESFEVNGRHRYKPEEFLEPTLGRQWEAGVKANLFDEKLGVTLAVFELRKENQPSFILTSLADERGLEYDPEEVSIDGHILYTSNAQQSRGIELDFNGKISEQLSLNGNYTYLRTSLLDDVVFQQGNELENAPNHSFGVWANYEFNRFVEGLSLGYGLFHQSQYFGDKDNSEGRAHPANTKMSAAVGYKINQIQFRLNVENLTDERTYFNSFGFYWLPQPPRRVLLSVAFHF